ncbi:MAG: TolC family protein [Longimicrobiales bacterium]
MRHWLLTGSLVGVLLVNAVSLAAQKPVAEVTLDQAIALALQHSPQIAQAEGSVVAAGWSERSAWGAFLPSLSVGSGASLASTERFNPQTNTSVTGSSDSYSAGLSSSIELFSGGRRTAELRRSRAETTASEASLVEQRYGVTLTTKITFFDALRADETIRSAEARLQRAGEGLEAATRREQVGSGTRSDVLRAQLELTNAKQALLQAENQRTIAAFALGRLVGAEGPVVARSDGALEPRPLSLDRDALIELIAAQAPTVISAQADAAASEASLRASRAQYLPTVTASGGYDWYNQDPRLVDGRTSWTLRLGVSYPVFNRFQREDAVARAEVQASVARSQFEDARRASRAQLESLLAALELAEQQIALATEAVTVAEEDLRVQQERYRLGVSTILERLTSEENLVAAEADLIASRYEYQIALAQIEALAGREL